MEIRGLKVVTMDYTMKDGDGQVLESSEPDEPLEFLYGIGNMLPGIEKALTGHREGDRLELNLSPEEAYGVYDKNLCSSACRDDFDNPNALYVGMEVEQEGDGQDPLILTITEISGDTVYLDGNHPLAGEALSFSLYIRDVRDTEPGATDD